MQGSRSRCSSTRTSGSARARPLLTADDERFFIYSKSSYCPSSHRECSRSCQ
jgi:hypothetical protein